jgi:hypothetical protein
VAQGEDPEISHSTVKKTFQSIKLLLQTSTHVV